MPSHGGPLAGIQHRRASALDRSQLERGLQHTSGRECLPLPICIGQLLHISRASATRRDCRLLHDSRRRPLRGDSYMGYFERFIADQRLADVFLLNPGEENDYSALAPLELAQTLSPAIHRGRHSRGDRTGSEGGGCARQPGANPREWRRLAEATESLDQFQAGLPRLRPSGWRRCLGLGNPLACPRVVVTGDFFTRFSPFFMEGVSSFMPSTASSSSRWIWAIFSFTPRITVWPEPPASWGMKPGGLALAKACLRIFQPDGKDYLRQWTNIRPNAGWNATTGAFPQDRPAGGRAERRLVAFEKASRHVSPALFGEVIPTSARDLEAASEGYDGIFVIGPFNCLPYRISEAILKPLSLQAGTPLLTYESDGYAVRRPSSGRWKSTSSKFSTTPPDGANPRTPEPHALATVECFIQAASSLRYRAGR